MKERNRLGLREKVEREKEREGEGRENLKTETEIIKTKQREETVHWQAAGCDSSTSRIDLTGALPRQPVIDRHRYRQVWGGVVG